MVENISFQQYHEEIIHNFCRDKQCIVFLDFKLSGDIILSIDFTENTVSVGLLTSLSLARTLIHVTEPKNKWNVID